MFGIHQIVRYLPIHASRASRTLLGEKRVSARGSRAGEKSDFLSILLVVLGGMLTAGMSISVVLPVLYEIVHRRDVSHSEGGERG